MKINKLSKIIITFVIFLITCLLLQSEVKATDCSWVTTYYPNNCTWYACGRVKEVLGINIDKHWGDAYQWADAARNAGYVVDNNAAPNTVAVWPRGTGVYGYGHVAFVERVNGNMMHVSEYNYSNPYAYGEADCQTNSSRGYGGAPQFIHFTAPDSVKPTISGCYIDMLSITSTSYVVRCYASDNTGIKEVLFPTWTVANDQDDVVWGKGTYDSSLGCYKYTVKKSQHKNESGLYMTHVYVYDNAGNYDMRGLEAIQMGSTVADPGNFTARIVCNKNKSYVIGTNGTSSGSKLQLESKSSSDSTQLWKLIRNSDKSYCIQNVSTGLYMDVNGGVNADGTAMQLWTKNSSNAQQFYIMNYNGAYRIVARCSPDLKAVDLNGGTVKVGQPINIYKTDHENNDAQAWIFEKIATELTISAQGATLYKGETYTLSAWLNTTSASNSKITWKSSNKSVATVDSNGKITAINPGTATITASTTDGTALSKSCSVTVNGFKDVATNSWYDSAVKYMYKNDIMKGYNATTFAPNDKVTRAMFATIIYNMSGRPAVKNFNSKFKDVKYSNETSWYYYPVVWASENNIVSGYKNGNFGPNDTITREDLAVMLNNYCNYKRKYKTVKADYSKFSDVNKISSYAKWAMNWAVGNGVITGDQGKLNPRGNATRAEVASMVYKYCLNIGK